MFKTEFNVGEIATVDFSGKPSMPLIFKVQVLEVDDDDPRKETMYKVKRLSDGIVFWLYENVLNKKEKRMNKLIDSKCNDFTEYAQIADAVRFKYKNGTVIDGVVNGVSPTLMSINTKAFRRMVYLSDLMHCDFVIEVLEQGDLGINAQGKTFDAVYVKPYTQPLPKLKEAVVDGSDTFAEACESIAEGRKYDSGKPMYNLLPADALDEVVKVLTYGAVKYNEPIDQENWRLVQNPEQRYFAACQRHLWAIRRGEATDQESGILHYAHAITSLMFLLQLELEKQK